MLTEKLLERVFTCKEANVREWTECGREVDKVALSRGDKCKNEFNDANTDSKKDTWVYDSKRCLKTQNQAIVDVG